MFRKGVVRNHLQTRSSDGRRGLPLVGSVRADIATFCWVINDNVAMHPKLGRARRKPVFERGADPRARRPAGP